MPVETTIRGIDDRTRIMEDNTSIKQKLREYIKDNVLFRDAGTFDEDTSFTESGILDSTGFLGLITHVEATFGIEITDEELDPDNLETLSKVAGFIERKLQEKEAA